MLSGINVPIGKFENMREENIECLNDWCYENVLLTKYEKCENV